MWAALSPDHQVIVYRELFDKGLVTIGEVCDRIKRLEGWTYSEVSKKYVQGEGAERIALRLIDTSAQEPERTSGETMLQRFMKEGITCRLAQKRNYDAGIDAIHEALTVRFQWGEPGLIVFNTCPTVKRNFMNFCWDDWATSRLKDLNDPKQSVRKKEDDFIDCIRYIYQSGLSYAMLRSSESNEDRRQQDESDSTVRGIGLLSGNHYGGKIQWQTSLRSNRPRASSSPLTGLRFTSGPTRQPK
jgi:hypothetical protein